MSTSDNFDPFDLIDFREETARRKAEAERLKETARAEAARAEQAERLQQREARLADLQQHRDERAREILSRPTGDPILYRTGSAPSTGLVICRTHLIELRDYKFHGVSALSVRAVGPRERMYGIEPLCCGLCAIVASEGNVCRNDDCKTPLHPQWPAVYCSTGCALMDC